MFQEYYKLVMFQLYYDDIKTALQEIQVSEKGEFDGRVMLIVCGRGVVLY